MELSEEKKAMETLKEVASDDFDTLGDDISPKMAQNILNVISNLRKEKEELKSIASEFTNRNIEQFSIGEFNFKVKHFKDNYIHKDKIIEIIEHYNNELEHIKNGEEFENEKPMYYWGKIALENLLEEN